MPAERKHGTVPIMITKSACIPLVLRTRTQRRSRLSTAGRPRPRPAPHLGDDGDPEPQIVQADLGNVDAIDNDLALGRLVDPKQAQGQG